MRMIEKKSYTEILDPKRGEELLQVVRNPFQQKFTDNVLSFTAWFHDCYYDPYLGSPVNELYSNNIFEAMVYPDVNLDSSFDTSTYETVKSSIHATGKHLGNLSDDASLGVQTLLFMDLDMHGFCDAAEYARNNVAVAKEYYATSLEEYLPKRKWFLETLLKKDRIYYLYADKYEEAARKNIEASIAILNKGLCDF